MTKIKKDLYQELFGALEIAKQRDSAEEELKRKERALRESEEKYRVISENAPFGMALIDKYGKFSYINKKFTEICGYSREELPDGKTWFHMAYPDKEYRAEAIKTWIEDLNSIKPRKGRHRIFNIICKDGTERVISFMPVMLENGENLMTCEDITEQKKFEKKLIESEEKYKGIFQNASEGIFQSTFDGKYIDANPAIAKILGYESPEELMREVSDISAQLYVNSQDRQHVNSEIKSKGKINNFETKLKRKDGKEIFVKMSARAVKDKSGEISYIEGIVDDVTLEKQLEKASRMEAIGQLAGGIAHDVNNQLTVIMGYSQLIQVTNDISKTKEFGKYIDQSSKRCSDITKQLLTYARKAKYMPQPVKLPEIVENTINFLSRSTDKRINISMNTKSFNIYTMGDSSLIENVILNVAINAIHAMPDGGELKFEIDKKDIGDKKYSHIVVEDTGHGMSREIMEHIFEPYFTTKDPEKGTGLGLASVYGIIEQHSGEIHVKSDINKGTRFDIYLPYHQIKESYEDVRTMNEIVKGRGKILLADDEEYIRNISHDLFIMAGYEIETAKDGKEAIEKFKKAPGIYDIVILDMNMPVVNGKDAYKAIKEINPEIKTIFFTGYSKDDYDDFLKDKNVKEVIQKPFQITKITEIVKKYI